jgi:soluble lytic murein transglycosylase
VRRPGSRGFDLARMVRLLALAVAVLGFFAAGAARAELTGGDRQIYRNAFAAAKAGDYAAAQRQAAQAKDPLLAKVLLWQALKGGRTGAGFGEITAFMKQNPEWPAQSALRQRAEEALAGVPDAVLREWFAANRPVTPYGRLRQAEMMMASGQQAAGLAQIRDVWVASELSAFDEKTILQRFPGVIRTEDHIRRLDRLVWDGLSDSARRLMPRVPPEYRLLADARLKLAGFLPGVEGAVAKVPAQLQNDPGLQYERLRWRRRKEMYPQALEILMHPPRELVRPAAWWTERQILARRALNDGKAKLAYDLVAKHELTDGPAYADAEFFAGWIAFRFLKDAPRGYEHFVRLHKNAKLPISVARGAYWAGRAAEAQNFKQIATDWYAVAAAHPTTYYGQLAAAKLGGGEQALRIPPEPKPSAEERAQFHRRDLVRVVEALAEIGEYDRIPAFMQKLSELAKTPTDHVQIAILGDATGRSDLAVAAAKRAGYAGVNLIDHGYPVIELPPGGDVERPLVLAMARQESAFEREAVSRTGARGLMQLMPATAKSVAKSMQLPFSADRLLTDSRYNLTLGRAYLDGLLSRFAGSYVLSVASYNAGPGRIGEWIGNFGDPRTKGVDVVDWIESIPFAETRNYVQRVLENLQVYRIRLGEHAVALSLTSDLRR